MAAVANVTELANSTTIGNELSALSSPALVKSVVMINLMYAENLPERTNVKKFRKNGSLTATNPQAEATALAIGSGGELTDSGADATAAKAAIVSGISVEEQKFGTIDLERVGNEQFGAIARAVDTDGLSMFSGLSTSVTSTSVLTIDDVMLGQFNIYNSNCPNQEVPLSTVVAPRAGYNLKKELINSGASVWTNPAMLGLFNGAPVQPNGYIGSIPGVSDFYQTTGHATSGGDDVQAIFHPMWAFAGMFDAVPTSWLSNKGSEGFFTELASYYFYDVVEWNDLCGVKLLSDT